VFDFYEFLDSNVLFKGAKKIPYNKK